MPTTLSDLLPRIKRNNGVHSLITGATGTGKTFLMEYLAQFTYPFVVIHDYKGNLRFTGFERVHGLKELFRKQKAQRIIYVPTPDEIGEIEESGELFCKFIYQRENTLLVIDELRAMVGDNGQAGQWLRSCLQQGREKNISLVCCTQRPASIPLVAITEASNIYCFFLQWKDDRVRIESTTGISAEDIETLQDQEFFLYTRNPRDTQGPFRLEVVDTEDYQ